MKMRRGETARIFDTCADMGQVYSWFYRYLTVLHRKAEAEVPSFDPTRAVALRAAKAGLAECAQGLADCGVAPPSDDLRGTSRYTVRPRSAAASPSPFSPRCHPARSAAL